jgi:hypothetical protein
MKTTLFSLLLALTIKTQGQTLYSATVAGFVEQPVTAGVNLLTLPVSATTNGNAEGELNCLSPGDQLLFWNATHYVTYTYLATNTWVDQNSNQVNTPLLTRGTGFFYKNVGTAKVNEFIGTFPATSQTIIPAGYSLLGSQIPATASVTNTLINLPLQYGDQIMTWNGAGYNIAYYYGNGNWFDASHQSILPPTISAGQGFFFISPAAVNWVQAAQ